MNPGPFTEAQENPKSADWRDRSRYLPIPQLLGCFVGDDRHIISVAIDAKQSKRPKDEVNQLLQQVSERAYGIMMELAGFISIDELAEIMGLPTWESIVEGNDNFTDEVSGAIREAEEADDDVDRYDDDYEEDEERSDAIEAAIHHGYWRTWASGVENAFTLAAEAIGADIKVTEIPIDDVAQSGQYELGGDWGKSAHAFFRIANSLDDRFEGMTLSQAIGDELGIQIRSRAGATLERAFCVGNLALLRRAHQVHGGPSPVVTYQRAW